MAEPRRIKTRIVHKHATAAVWDTKLSFVPLQGELIIYDADDRHPYQRFKIGDGSTTVVNLPFANAGHTDTADKLETPRNINLAGDVTGQTIFDGSKDVTINTALQGTFEGQFTGKSASHTHTFTGKSTSGTTHYTPEGQVEGTYTPSGTISTPIIDVHPFVNAVTVVTEVSDGQYYPGNCIFPNLIGELNDDELILDVTGGSYTPGQYRPGEATSTTFNYLAGISATSSTPEFTGKEATIPSKFIGKEALITTTFIPEGEIDETAITPEGEININYLVDYKITYVTYGGTPTPSKVTYNIKDEFEFDSVIKSGYTFNGWYVNNDTLITGIQKGTRGNLVLHAKYSPKTYTITYLDNELILNDYTNYPHEYNIETPTFDLPIPEVESGYTFNGWKDTNDVIISSIIEGSIGNLILEPIIEKIG